MRPLMVQVQREGGAQATGGSIPLGPPAEERQNLAEVLRALAGSVERGALDEMLGLGDGTVAGTGYTDDELKGTARDGE